MSIPPLRVKKNWYVGLNPDPVDHSHMDVGDNKANPKPNSLSALTETACLWTE